MNWCMHITIENWGPELEDTCFKMTWPKIYPESLTLNLIDCRDRLKRDLFNDEITKFDKIFLKGKLDAVELILRKSHALENWNNGLINNPKRVIESFFKYISVYYYKSKRSFEKAGYASDFNSLRLLATCAELLWIFKDISNFYLDGR